MEPTYRIAQRLHERRAAMGLPKYGQHLTANSHGCMLVHALEEAADLTEYLLAEVQRRKIVLETFNELSKEMNAELAIGWAYKLEKLYDLLGGKSAIEQYDEILGSGTIAENATVAPSRSMPKEQLDRIRQEIAKVAAINRPLTPEEREDFDRAMAELPEAHEATDPRDEALPKMREYRFDRYVNGKLKAEGAALVAENDREAAEKLTKLCCDHPVIMIGFAVQPMNDPRDEALRVAAEALIHVRHEIIGIANRANGDEWLVAVAHRSVAVIAEALAAIHAAGGAR